MRTRFAKRELKFHKVDKSEGVAYGWLIVSTIGGEPYFDLQGDHIPIGVAKHAMVDFMKNSRASDDQHDERTIGEVVYCLPVEKGVTSSLVHASGEVDQEGIVIGFKPHDPAVLEKIANGERTGFSIGGTLSEAHYVEKGAKGTQTSERLKGAPLAQADLAFQKDRRARIKKDAEPRTRRVFDDFRIDFASLVDYPAQEGAVVAIVKAATVAKGTLMFIRKDAVLTSEEKGHQHVIDPDEDLDEDGDCGWTGSATASGDEWSHSHEFVVDTKTGAVTIASTNGHGHTVDLLIGRTHSATEDNASTAQVLTPVAARAPASARPTTIVKVDGIETAIVDAVAGQNRSERVAVVDMTPEQIAALNKSLVEANARTEALLSLTPDQFTTLASLSKSEQSEILDAPKVQRTSLIKAAQDADPEVYKTRDGISIHKSDGKLAEMQARKIDKQAEQLDKAEAETDRMKFEKRATAELAHLPGDVAHKAALLKAVDGIADEKARAGALAAIKAGEKAVAKAFGRVGKGGGLVGDADANDADPADKIDQLAKKYAKEHKVTFDKAYAAVMETDEGAQLYAELEVRGGQPTTAGYGNAEVDDYDDDETSGVDADAGVDAKAETV